MHAVVAETANVSDLLWSVAMNRVKPDAVAFATLMHELDVRVRNNNGGADLRNSLKPHNLGDLCWACAPPYVDLCGSTRVTACPLCTALPPVTPRRA